jgi:hypothetical protein
MRVPWHVRKSSREFHAPSCILGGLASPTTCSIGSERLSFAHGEITDDWSQIATDELESESDGIAHLDAFGFCYYIPALMVSVLNHYESSSMRVVGTLGGLYPKKDNRWEYKLNRYSLLNPAQKTPIARFLAALAKLVELGFQDQKIVPRALRNYWGEYLQNKGDGITF